MARQKLTPKQKAKIIADYISCRNYSEIARKYKVTVNAVKNIVQNNPDTANKCKQKEEEIIIDTLDYIQSRHEKKKQLLDKILDAMEGKAENVDMFTNIKDLATAYGIVLDKELKFRELKLKEKEAEQKNNLGEDKEINIHIIGKE